MRALRLTLAGTVVLALVGGLSGAVVAQAHEGTNGGFTQVWMVEEPDLQPAVEDHDHDDFVEFTGFTQVWMVEASDPRLSPPSSIAPPRLPAAH